VFIAGDLLWYPVEGSVKTHQALDIMVIFGRPKGKRGSYKQWEENNIAPQVVFEILSPGNRSQEMAKKLLFYQRYGVEEYYVYHPEKIELTGFILQKEWLEDIEEINNWVSPRLGIRLEITSSNLEIYYPNGKKFLTFLELNQRAENEYERAEQEYKRAEQERQNYQDLLAKLEAKGIDINTL
jgi:Uma2 family endonuclease